MAEAFATAASVLQVAEVGFSLATTLYKYATSVKGAEKEIKKIAREVKLTSKVLERTYEQLKADRQAQLCTEDALSDLEDALEGCKEAFQEVEGSLNKSLKPDSEGKLYTSTFDKFKWPLRSNKLEVLRANLEKLKTTLLLMLTVLAYGNRLSQNKAMHASVKIELTLEELQIQNLVQAKEEATQRYEELRIAFQRLEARIDQNTNAFANPAMPHADPTVATIAMLPSFEAPASGDTMHHGIPADVSSGLALCASAASKLTMSIDDATKKWQSEQELEQSAIAKCLNETTGAVHSLASMAAGNHALQDYQMQLMLQERQNKKTLLMARQEQHAPQQMQSQQPQVMTDSASQHKSKAGDQALIEYQEQMRLLDLQCVGRRQVPHVKEMSNSPIQQQGKHLPPQLPAYYLGSSQDFTSCSASSAPFGSVAGVDLDSNDSQFSRWDSGDVLDNFDFDCFSVPEKNAAGEFDLSDVLLEDEHEDLGESDDDGALVGRLLKRWTRVDI